MTFYLTGIGLNKENFSWETYKTCEKADEIYLESYTVDFPYKLKDLEKELNVKINTLNREQVESEEFLRNAKSKDVVLLVYGDALSATTHTQLIQACKKNKIPYKIHHNASILTAISESGLQLYKFGKTASMPSWQTNFKPTSFIDLIKQNQKIKAHSLLLIDIGLGFKQAKKQLEQASKEKNFKIEKIIICSQLGTKNPKILYNTPNKISESNVKPPYCIIIPSDLHFSEEEFLKNI